MRYRWSLPLTLLMGIMAGRNCLHGVAGAMTLVRKGVPQATIVVAATATQDPPSPGPAQKVAQAAGDLQHYLEKMSGARLPIVADTENPSGAVVLVGRSKLTEALEVAVPSGLTHARREEGFVIFCQGSRLLLAGNDEGPYHGTEYAVYDFLNRLGVRWFMPGEWGEVVPRQATLTVPALQVREKPDFIVRSGEGDPRWQMRNKQNPTGGDMGFGANDTSVWYLMPPFEERPELYALDSEGQRDRNLGVCYSNPATAQTVAASIMDQFRKNPELNSVGFAPPDGVPRCLCPECPNLNQGFPHGTGGTWASMTEEWMGFVNQVAAAVGREFPDRYVASNGYSNRVIPPQGMKLQPNVAMMFAAIEDCTLHAYDDPHCWQKQKQAEMLKQWLELTHGKVQVYEYLINMMVSSLTPIPMVHRIRRDIPLMKKWGVMGFTSCTRNCWAEEGIATKYVRAQLQWDAEADVEAILQDFYSRWYGKAARPMRAYFDALEKALDETSLHGHENTFMAQVYTQN